jgi:transcriptional regulator with GAF, ATPase, and Fis domain
LDAATDELHRRMLAEAIEQNRTLAEAARQLQISLRRLHYLIIRHGIERTVSHTVTVRFKSRAQH